MNELTGALPAHLMAAKTEEKSQKSMGKDDFMKLLLAQLQHQDPLNPMDHKDMSAQLAQFSSLEQLSNIGSGIQNLKSGMGEDAKLQATGLIGRRVALSGNEIELVEGQTTNVGLDRSGGYEPVKVTIYSGDGKPVRELPITQKEANAIAWDGKNNEGADVPAGKYGYRIVGVDKNGQSKELTGEASGRVVGVELNGKDAMLVIDNGAGRTKVELGKVRSIAMDESALGARPNPAPQPGAPSAPGGLAPGAMPTPANLERSLVAAAAGNSSEAKPAESDESDGPAPTRDHEFLRTNWMGGMERP